MTHQIQDLHAPGYGGQHLTEQDDLVFLVVTDEVKCTLELGLVAAHD